MKTKKFKIRIQAINQTLDDFESAFNLVSKNKTKNSGELVLGFESFQLLSKILSPERLKLLRTIRDKKPSSVSELARMRKRAQANVHKDIQFLAELGIVTLKESRKSGQKGKSATQPTFDYDGFDIAL